MKTYKVKIYRLVETVSEVSVTSPRELSNTEVVDLIANYTVDTPPDNVTEIGNEVSIPLYDNVVREYYEVE